MINYYIDDSKIEKGFENISIDIDDYVKYVKEVVEYIINLIDNNGKLSKTDIDDLIKVCQENAAEYARLGIQGGKWKLVEEIKETEDAVKIYKDNLDKHSTILDNVKSNIYRELASAFSLYIKYSYESRLANIPVNVIVHIRFIDLCMSLINVNTINQFISSYTNEMNELKQAFNAYDEALHVLSIDKEMLSDKIDVMTYNIMKLRTPELLQILTNKEIKPNYKIIKELRHMARIII